MTFTLRFLLALVLGIVAAVVAAPFAAVAVARAGLHYPFPRIFDRVAMLSIFAAMALNARKLRLIPLLRAGFRDPTANLGRCVRGLAVALGVMAILFAMGIAMGAAGHAQIAHAARLLPKYLIAAIAIGVLEEAFFRAILFGGMTSDFGRTGAIIASSAIYSLAHLVRSPAHFYVTQFDAGAGIRSFTGSLAQFATPSSAIPTLFGLFLLGIVLATAFAITGRVYFSIGLHAGFVVGAKLWPKLVRDRAVLPGWLAGWGRQPLISGAAAWIFAIAILVMLPRLVARDRSTV